jgi:hypothetical protein
MKTRQSGKEENEEDDVTLEGKGEKQQTISLSGRSFAEGAKENQHEEGANDPIANTSLLPVEKEEKEKAEEEDEEDAVRTSLAKQALSVVKSKLRQFEANAEKQHEETWKNKIKSAEEADENRKGRRKVTNKPAKLGEAVKTTARSAITNLVTVLLLVEEEPGAQYTLYRGRS